MTSALVDKGLKPGTWTIDPVHSSVSFTVRHFVVSKVRGTFEDFTGQIVIGEDGTPTVTAEVRADSVNTSNEQRDEHIRSADFFKTDEFPVATFRSKSVSQSGSDYVLTGDFTLRGVTNEVELSVEFLGVHPGMGNGPVAGFEASTVLNRRDYGISIDMPMEGGGAVVGDKITIDIAIEAGLQS